MARVIPGHFGTVVVAAAVTSIAACGGPDSSLSDEPGGDDTPSDDGNFLAQTYERNFVFAALDGDSLFLVPWLLETVATQDTVVRDAAGWLARGGIWDPFYSERWYTSPTREPSRVLPHGDMTFMVREGDAIDGIVFERASRSLEMVLGDVKATWVGPRGEAFELLEGATYLADQRVDGVVLDMARAAGGDTPRGGDWLFLLSGDSAHFVLAGEFEHGGEIEPRYRGWADAEGSALQWTDIQVDWWETQAFPPARRDVPVAWRVWSDDGLVEAELQAVSAEIQPGNGPGPLLPVRALFEVVGDFSTVSGNFPVHGILVHHRR